MKYILGFLLLISLNSFSATYYFSSTGNDNTGNGSIGTPWQTLNKLSSITLAAGDIIAFKSGETITGTASINQNGASGNPITFTTYNGTTPAILSGFGSLASTGLWTNVGSVSMTSTSIETLS